MNLVTPDVRTRWLSDRWPDDNLASADPAVFVLP